jgi:hypothetical protein
MTKWACSTYRLDVDIGDSKLAWPDVAVIPGPARPSERPQPWVSGVRTSFTHESRHRSLAAAGRQRGRLEATREVRLACVSSRQRLRELAQTKRIPGTGQRRNRARQELTRQQLGSQPGRSMNDVSTHHMLSREAPEPAGSPAFHRARCSSSASPGTGHPSRT